MDENQISKIVLNSAIEVHRLLGPGLLESVYEKALAFELTQQGLLVQTQVPVTFKYKQLVFEDGFRADVIINQSVVLELKSVAAITDLHKKQLLTYIKLLDMKLGMLINFNVQLLKDGVIRIVNGL
ncbi:MAG: GxxExxY protein [Candidatus Sumerlaeia bacterium]|nr:GxxExxY protein [Candidatus Sumerlaeia bacterium]